jgi:hypothetical protein
MKTAIQSLFVVAALAAPAGADKPRLLRTGSPACGNVMSERMQRSKKGPSAAERKRIQECKALAKVPSFATRKPGEPRASKLASRTEADAELLALAKERP